MEKRQPKTLGAKGTMLVFGVWMQNRIGYLTI